MTAAEFRIWREHLGLTHAALAAELHVDERTVRRWEAGGWAVPAIAAIAVQDLVDAGHDEVDDHVVSAQRAIVAGQRPVLQVWRTQERCAADHAGALPRYLTPGYHRAVAGQVLASLPANSVSVVYVEDEGDSR